MIKFLLATDEQLNDKVGSWPIDWTDEYLEESKRNVRTAAHDERQNRDSDYKVYSLRLKIILILSRYYFHFNGDRMKKQFFRISVCRKRRENRFSVVRTGETFEMSAFGKRYRTRELDRKSSRASNKWSKTIVSCV